jgi:crotonobetainyl-CoA:carnitine CoA-transferase CaiB-like acyl-CoA transferase
MDSRRAEMTSEHHDPGLPLAGLRVLELAVWVAGPAAAGVMADWGADVIKVESPDGDPQRAYMSAIGISASAANPAFDQDNRAKRSAVLNLRTEQDRELFEELLAWADIFVTNLRTDALERLALSAGAVSQRHPRLIVAALTGYGSVGPLRNTAAYDAAAFLSRSGLGRTNSPAEQPPLRLRRGVGDHVAAMTLTAGVLAAVHQRDVTGRGQIVETSLFQAGMYAVSWDLSTHLTNGSTTALRVREHSETPLVNTYQAADGSWLYLVCLEAERHFPKLMAALGRTDLLEDPRFRSSTDLYAHASELVAILDEAFASRSRDEWAVLLDQHDVWWSPCQTLAEVTTDPQALALDAFVSMPDPSEETDVDHQVISRTVASPVRFGGRSITPRGPSPRLGQHTAEIREQFASDRSRS